MEARIGQVLKPWIYNLRVPGSNPTAVGMFFWYGPLAILSHQIASMGSDHHAKIMEVPTSGLGSKSLHGCKRSTSPFLLRATKFQRMKCKQMAEVDRPPTSQDHPLMLQTESAGALVECELARAS